MNNYLNPIVDLPYPEIKVNKKDPIFAYKIFKLYSSEVSELTASTRYSYQHMILENYKELANIFKKISITEMKHLEILGNLIIKLGLKPFFVDYKSNGKVIPWNSDFINYTDDYEKILITDIEEEKKAINEYKKIIMETDDINIKNILKRIIIDEEKHIEIFTILLNEYNSTK